MDKPAWNSDLLDWLAADFERHGFDVKHTLEVILTSSAYAQPAVEAGPEKAEYVFHGPLVRRLTAEQFSDAISALTGDWAPLAGFAGVRLYRRGGSMPGAFQLPRWIWTDEPVQLGPQRCHRAANSAHRRAAKTAAARKRPRKRGAGRCSSGGTQAEADAATSRQHSRRRKRN